MRLPATRASSERSGISWRDRVKQLAFLDAAQEEEAGQSLRLCPASFVGEQGVTWTSTEELGDAVAFPLFAVVARASVIRHPIRKRTIASRFPYQPSFSSQSDVRGRQWKASAVPLSQPNSQRLEATCLGPLLLVIACWLFRDPPFAIRRSQGSPPHALPPSVCSRFPRHPITASPRRHVPASPPVPQSESGRPKTQNAQGIVPGADCSWSLAIV